MRSNNTKPKKPYVLRKPDGSIAAGTLTYSFKKPKPGDWIEVLNENTDFRNPTSYTNTVRVTYPTAVSAQAFGEYTKKFLKNLGYSTNNTLMSLSVCSDDVNAPNFLDNDNLGQHPLSLNDFLGPFMSGGLAGYPHTGVLGLQAWASHITANGSLFLTNMPHIGISQVGNVGRMWRRGKTQAQSLTDNTCGAVVTAAQWVMTNLAGGSAPVRGSGVFANNDQYFVLANILYTNRATLCSTPYNFVLDPTKYGAGVKLATEYIRADADTFLTGASGIIAANVGSNVDVFFCSGTFINVDDGYEAYIDVNKFEKWNSTTGWSTTLTALFKAGLPK